MQAHQATAKRHADAQAWINFALDTPPIKTTRGIAKGSPWIAPPPRQSDEATGGLPYRNQSGRFVLPQATISRPTRMALLHVIWAREAQTHLSWRFFQFQNQINQVDRTLKTRLHVDSHHFIGFILKPSAIAHVRRNSDVLKTERALPHRTEMIYLPWDHPFVVRRLPVR